MNLDRYQALAAGTAVYPTLTTEMGTTNPFYAALGLIGESLEFESAPDDVDELGDVLWYAAILSMELGFSLNNVYGLGWERVAHRGMRQDSLLHLAAEVAEPIKKLWRDGPSLKHKLSVKDSLADMMVLIENTANADPLGVELQTVCDRNLAKLASRKDRGVLSGDGSSR